MAQPRATEVGSSAFSCEVDAPVTVESSSHVTLRYSSRPRATVFTLLSSVDVIGHPGLATMGGSPDDVSENL